MYVRICMLIYSRGGPISVEHVKRCCRNEHGNKVNSLIEKLVKTGKIERNGDEIDQKRCRKEIEKALNLIRNASENGSKGNKIRWKGVATRSDAAIANHQPSTTNHQPSKKEDSSLRSESAPQAASNGHDKRKAKGNGAEKGHRLPADWEPGEELREFARQCGLDPDAVLAEFRDYWLDRSRDATRVSWSGTWRNRCRELAKRSTRDNHRAGSILDAAQLALGYVQGRS